VLALGPPLVCVLVGAPPRLDARGALVFCVFVGASAIASGRSNGRAIWLMAVLVVALRPVARRAGDLDGAAVGTGEVGAWVATAAEAAVVALPVRRFGVGALSV